MMPRLIKLTPLVGFASLLMIGALGGWAFRESKKVPEFYEQAIQMPAPEALAESNEELEASVQQLQCDAAQQGRWEAAFEADQINAWLTEQLPKKVPILRARGLQEPRIVIEPGTLRLAARFKDKRFDAVISCQLGVRLTDQPNRLAVSVREIRAGALPLPLSQFQEKIKRITSRTKLNLEWETQDGETFALISVPSEYPGHVDGSVVIEAIELAGGTLSVAGRTADQQVTDFSPQGVVFRIAERSDELAETSTEAVEL